MKIRNSLKSAKLRDKNCRVVRRHGRVYVINKKKPAHEGPPGLNAVLAPFASRAHISEAIDGGRE